MNNIVKTKLDWFNF